MFRYARACRFEIAPVPMIPTLNRALLLVEACSISALPRPLPVKWILPIMRPTIWAGCALVCLLLAAGCKRSPSTNVAATVNNRVITYAELEKNYHSQFPAATDGSSEDQVMIQKLELLRNLIDSEIMLQRTEKMGLMAVDADVDAKFNELKAPYTKEEFEKQLKNRNMTMEDLKGQIRRDLS